MRKRWIVLIALLLFAAVAVGGWWFLDENPAWAEWAEGQLDRAAARFGLGMEEETTAIVASGFIEAEQASVATDLGGRIVAIHADEGDEVTEGQVLVELDDALLQAQIGIAEAELAAAEAQLAQVKAGVRPETLASAEAMLRQAETAYQVAQIAWQDAQAMLENPQDLELALVTAQAQARVLQYQQEQAAALANAAQVGRDLADEMVGILEDFEPRTEWVAVASYEVGNLPPELPLPPDWGDGEYYFQDYKVVIKDGIVTLYKEVRIAVPPDKRDEAYYRQATATNQSWLAWLGLAQARAARQGAENSLAELARQAANPLTLQAQANAAQAQVQIAAAAVEMAQAQVDGLKMGATPEQIAAVEAQVEMARAALETLRVQQEKFTLRAPLSGLVLERSAHVGEVARPGTPLLTLADLEDLTLTVYVPEDQIGRVRIGQPVSVTVDAYPDRVFTGTVTFIAGEAEFTPKNIQTKEERVSMVFAVKVSLPNPDHALKPGMPADAVLAER